MSTKAAKPKSRQLSPRFLEAIMAPGANIGINQALETNDIMSYIDVKNIYIQVLVQVQFSLCSALNT